MERWRQDWGRKLSELAVGRAAGLEVQLSVVDAAGMQPGVARKWELYL